MIEQLKTAKVFMISILGIALFLFISVVIYGLLGATTVTTDSGAVVNATTINTILAGNGSVTSLSQTPNAALNATAVNNSNLRTGLSDAVAYVNVSGLAGSLIFNGNFTISVWINYTQSNGFIPPADSAIIANNHSWNTYKSVIFGFTTTNDNSIEFDLNNGTVQSASGMDILFGTNFLKNRWLHYVAVYNGANATVYLDGVLNKSNGSIRCGCSPENPADFTIGGYKAVGAPSGFPQDVVFNGSIDELRIYNDSLTLAQIVAINASGREPNTSLRSQDLQLWLSFNERSGTTFYDKSGNGNNGTIVKTGTVTWQTVGGNSTVSNGTNFIVKANNLTIIDAFYGFNPITVSYNYSSITSSTITPFAPIAGNLSSGYTLFSAQFPTMFVLLGLTVIIVVLLILVKVVQSQNSYPNI